MPPQSNATLVRVSTAQAPGAPAAIDDWDVDVAAATDPDAEGPLAAGDKWTGRIAGYVREKVDRIVGDGVLTLVTRRTLWVDSGDVPEGLDTDDVLDVELDDGTVVRARARTIARSRLVGVPARLQTTRIDLEEA